MVKTVIGVFNDFTAALNATLDLVSVGLPRKDISMIASDTKSHIGTDMALGGLGGQLLGMAALAIPGTGVLMAAGPLATALAGTTVGAVTGGLVGALSGMGVPQHEARAYEAGLREGHSLIVVRAEDVMVVQAMEILRYHRAVHVSMRSPRSANTDPTEFSSTSTY